MASAGPQRPTATTTSPLHQINKENTSPRSSHGSHDEPPQKTLRRSKSLRLLRRNVASSDSPPDDDSIYNAERVGSSEDLAWGEEPQSENTPDALAIFPLPLSSASPPNGTTISHSRWPAPQLNTILEANSVSSLRTSRSFPRLKASPGRTSRIVHPQSSINSIHPKQAPPSSKQILTSSHGYRRRSLSLNDLDCILALSTRKSRSPQSSSSDDALEQSARVPSFPNKPVEPPPYRIPTPPGLPPFGSQQATEYRLRPLNHRSLWNRLWHDSHDESDEQRAPSPRSIGSSSPIPPSQSASPSGEIFKRTLAMIGMSRVVSPPPSSAGPSRAPLPPGVYTSNIPGPLARADDGTYMRGRFGPRTSGHGIGSRNLESHPLAQLHSIDNTIREIDKACERGDIQQALAGSLESETGPGDTSHAQRNAPRGEASPRSRRSSREDRDAYHSGQSPPLFSSPSMPASEIDIPSSAQREFRNINLSHRPRVAQLRSPTDSTMMRYGPDYTPTTVVSLRSLGSHMSGIPEDGRPSETSETSSDEQRDQMRTAWNQMWSAFDDCCRVFWRGSWCNRDSPD
ncbi:hypothetical protein EDD37DRAFT_331663 [Exophiala viscosa]|uniref:Uncharacterized protein n=1 Tax=Exophiala viscosa TaxID=2486360 RepID=A0AAN6IDH6_9EURO|nr:hypothetical protein EDD36DRAFT_254002 [Exophiala viscosa]KAI1626129.1 hypothetical protein EDD37DRAFT_331663 [Exophiala viscosa]